MSGWQLPFPILKGVNCHIICDDLKSAMPKKKSGICEWRRALRLFSDPGGRYKRAVTMRGGSVQRGGGRWATSGALLGGVNNSGNGFDLGAMSVVLPVMNLCTGLK